MNPVSQSFLSRRFAVRIGAYVDEELGRGTDPLKIAMLLIQLAAELGQRDPVTANAALTRIADTVRDIAGRYRN